MIKSPSDVKEALPSGTFLIRHCIRNRILQLVGASSYPWTGSHCEGSDLCKTPVSITMSQGTARLQCHFKDVSANFDNTVIHWYQQKENREPVRMLYISSGTTTVENNFQRNRYMVQNLSNQKICILIIKNIGPDDAATYYCAYWDSHYDRNPAITSTNTPSENSEILQTKHKDQLLYVCLIENFYPEVIRVQWVDEANKEVTKNVIKGDVWKSTNDKYSVSTWLTLPGNTTNKNYYCKYDHESTTILKTHQ
uniref:Ig-like domain-containing protein n=1 Tax=Anas platyrhynchos platyrhynchos TaxID=8840 RepID=A0A493TAN2_ANAPP